MKGMKTGGRQKGTPNKGNPLKGYIRAHSLEYFKPKPQVNAKGEPRELVEGFPLVDENGNPAMLSDFDIDMMSVEPSERINYELRLLEFHTPKMKAVDVDMSVNSSLTIEDRLRQLCEEEVTDDDDEEEVTDDDDEDD